LFFLLLPAGTTGAAARQARYERCTVNRPAGAPGPRPVCPVCSGVAVGAGGFKVTLLRVPRRFFKGPISPVIDSKGTVVGKRGWGKETEKPGAVRTQEQ